MSVACLYAPAGLAPARQQSLAEACLRLSSQVALRGGEAVFVELAGSQRLFGEPRLRAGLRVLARRLAPGQPLWLGWGAQPGEALARACHDPAARTGAQAPLPLSAMPLQSLQAYAAPFGEDDEVRGQVQALLAALAALGLRSLGDFMGLPARGWGERFGPHAAVLRERLEGRMAVAWPRFSPAQRLEESADLRDLETLSSGPSDESLRFHLKQLCDRVAARLRGRGLRAAGLALTMSFEHLRQAEDAPPWRLELPLALPVAEPSQLRRLLQELMEQAARKRRLPRPLQGLALAVTATAPGFNPQREAFGSQEDEQEALNGLQGRLIARLGQDRVFYAQLRQRHLPEQAWVRQRLPPPPQPVQPKAGWGAVPRPSRLLQRPLLLTRAMDWLVYWGGGARTRRWRALDWQGPERIGLPWWEPAGPGPGLVDSPARDYWRVRTAEGQDLWVYSRQGDEAHGGALWLQGWWG
jgi:protein ImuB